MSKTQLVTFMPSDAFFFGGESTFGNGDNRNFYAASNAFPQQTTLVGVLRHALYEAGYANNIGESFRVNSPPNFGFLESISPVFIYQKGTKGQADIFALPVYLPNNEEGKVMPIQLNSRDNIKVNFGEGWQTALGVADYKEKYGMDAQLLFTGGETSLKAYTEVFEEVIKTGIARDRKAHTTKKGMFYQQTLFKLKKGYAFGALVTGTGELFSAIKHRNMPMGGEQKNFVLQTKTFDQAIDQTIDQTFEALFYQAYQTHCIADKKDWVLLTSDAYVSPKIYEYCQLAISDTKPFRNIITPKSSQYYSTLYSPDGDDKGKKVYAENRKADVKERRRYKSEQFTLLKRGTVLFPKGALSDLTNALTDKNFRTIGYNHYFTNPKTI